jgi:hypothetical protein
MSRSVRSLANENAVGDTLIEVTNAIEQSINIPAWIYIKIISVVGKPSYGKEKGKTEFSRKNSVSAMIEVQHGPIYYTNPRTEEIGE